MPELEKVKCSTPDFAKETAKKILALLPECAGEGGAVDIEKLKQCLSSKVIEGNVERYEFTWPGKRAAKAAASAATTKTLRPCREESVNFDSTENLYIEGDNLEVLKLLQTSYAGKVKMIYIDPPYNTGHDFVYRDRFSMTDKELATVGGAISDENGMGGIFAINDGAEARYHSNWCSMMYPRLKLARNLLSDRGLIFVSIDDNEITNQRRLLDEVFGESNFVAQIVWQKRTSPDARSNLSPAHDYIVVYAKDISLKSESLRLIPLSKDRVSQYQNPDDDPRGCWASVDITGQTGHATQSQFYEITTPGGVKMRPPAGRCWALAEPTFKKLVEDNRIWFGSDGCSRPRKKIFLSEVDGCTAWTWWPHVEVGSNQDSAKELKSMFGATDIFENPKPTKLLDRILRLASDSDSVILDFFSGSGSTAHAVMQLNAEDGGNRKFIMVQLPEVCAEDSEAAKAGYKNICEIGKERIRRAGKKIAEENATTAPNLDVGFRVLKLDSSSLNDTSSTVSETSQAFENFDRIKSDRSPEDLLFQMLLETRIPLSEPIVKAQVAGNEVFFVGVPADAQDKDALSGAPLAACLDQNAKMTTEFFIEVAKLKPGIAFFRDDAFADDSARTNLQQAFDQFSPSTSIKVI